MAGREVLDWSRLRDGNRASASQEHNVGGDSTHRINGNVQAFGRAEPRRAVRSSKNDDVGNSNSTTHFSITRTQGNSTNAGNLYHEQTNQPLTNRSITDQRTQGHEVQAPVQRDQNQNLAARAASLDLPGLIPPRETSPRPLDSEEDGVQNVRRMAVCQENDDAEFQRTKMRVYMKRF